jgi:hypothetical protein
MKTEKTNLVFIDTSGQTKSSSKMMEALKKELRKYDRHVIAESMLPNLTTELHGVQMRLALEHKQWKPVVMSMEGTIGHDLRWLYIGRELGARLIRIKGHLINSI